MSTATRPHCPYDGTTLFKLLAAHWWKLHEAAGWSRHEGIALPEAYDRLIDLAPHLVSQLARVPETDEPIDPESDDPKPGDPIWDESIVHEPLRSMSYDEIRSRIPEWWAQAGRKKDRDGMRQFDELNEAFREDVVRAQDLSQQDHPELADAVLDHPLEVTVFPWLRDRGIDYGQAWHAARDINTCIEVDPVVLRTLAGISDRQLDNLWAKLVERHAGVLNELGLIEGAQDAQHEKSGHYTIKDLAKLHGVPEKRLRSRIDRARNAGNLNRRPKCKTQLLAAQGICTLNKMRCRTSMR